MLFRSKASPALQKVLLNIFDRAELVLGDNTKVNLSRCLFFLTSNLGAKDLNRLINGGAGFSGPTVALSAAHAGAVTTSKKYFSPEFFNRLDKVITFRHLDREDLSKILTLELAKVELRAEGRFYLKLTPEAHAWLAAEGYQPEYGARHLRRAVAQRITLPIAKCLGAGQFTKHAEIKVSLRKDQNGLEFRVPAEFAGVSGKGSNG